MRRVLIPLALLLGAAGPPPAAVPYSRMDVPWWRARFAEKQAELRRGPVELVWYGDSITQDFELAGPEPWRDFAPVWQRYYAGRHALNLGFKGDATAHLLWRIVHGEAAGIHPKVAIVLIGANNFGHLHWAAEPSAEGVEAVVAALRERLPGTRILLVGVLPSVRSAWVDRNTAALNRLLAARYADGREARFFDLSGLFMSDGRVDPALFYDGHIGDPPLHPTPAAQARIAAALEPAVSAAMGDARR